MINPRRLFVALTVTAALALPIGATAWVVLGPPASTGGPINAPAPAADLHGTTLTPAPDPACIHPRDNHGGLTGDWNRVRAVNPATVEEWDTTLDQFLTSTTDTDHPISASWVIIWWCPGGQG